MKVDTWFTRKAPSPTWAWDWGEVWKVLESFLEKVILGLFSRTLNNILMQTRLNHLKISCNFLWSSLIERYSDVQVPQVRPQKLTTIFSAL